MTTYIALLRGINVSGQKKIKMAELQQQLEAAGLQAVQTYIQSGNIICQHESSPQEVRELIEQLIAKHYGFEVRTIVKTPDELRQILEKNPFADEDPKLQYFTLLAESPEQNAIEKLKTTDYSPEAFDLKGGIIYIYAANGYGRAKLNNNFLEKKLKVQASTRNLNTLNKLLEMSIGIKKDEP